MMASIEINNVTKSYPEFELGPINLTIKDGEFFGIFGPPSSGKTSILRIILGLLKPDAGSVLLDGKSTDGLEVDQRGISMVFQNLALFPHMTGRENIVFPLVVQKYPEKEIEKRLDGVAEVLHVSHILHKNPAQMSGGERQRIALGRAFASHSRAMLLDEPIASLDARLREEMRVELKRLQRENNQTFVYVSHDEEEVLAISDRVAVMIEGKIAQIGTPAEVYDSPNSVAVAKVIGSPPMNLFVGELSKGGKVFSGGDFSSDIVFSSSVGTDSTVMLGVRPEDFWLVEEKNGHPVHVTSCEPLGTYTIVNVLVGEKAVKIRAPGQLQLAQGETAYLRIDERHKHIFDEDGKRV